MIQKNITNRLQITNKAFPYHILYCLNKNNRDRLVYLKYEIRTQHISSPKSATLQLIIYGRITVRNRQEYENKP